MHRITGKSVRSTGLPGEYVRQLPGGPVAGATEPPGFPLENAESEPTGRVADIV